MHLRNLVLIFSLVLALRPDVARADEAMKAIHDALISKASEIQSIEYEITRTHMRLAQLRAKLAEMETSRASHTKTQKAASTSLMRIARRPQDMPFVSGIDLVRGELMLARAQQKIDHLLGKLVVRNQAIAKLASDVQKNERALKQDLKQRVQIHHALENLIERKKRGLKTKNSAALIRQAKKIAALSSRASSQAHSTNALISTIIEETKPRSTDEAQDAPRFLKPGVGKLTTGFGYKNALGMHSLGLGFEMISQARIIAPVSGQVVFAGPFRHYGHVLIIAAPGGYHLFLRGMSRLDVRAGEALAAGEPIGLMPRAQKKPRGTKKGAKKTRRNSLPVLYLEVRKNGRPIDPTSLFAENIRP